LNKNISFLKKKERKKERKKKKGIAVVTRGGALDIVSSRWAVSWVHTQRHGHAVHTVAELVCVRVHVREAGLG